MHCRPLRLFRAIGRERASDHNSVRLYRSRGKDEEFQAQPLDLCVWNWQLLVLLELTCGAADKYGMKTYQKSTFVS